MTTSVPSHFRRIAYTAAVFTIVLPIGILLSWVESPTSLPGLPSDFHTIKPNTALATLLCGLALLLQIQEPMTPLRRRLAQICATLACLIAGGTLLVYFFLILTGVHPLQLSRLDIEVVSSPWQMAPPTAFAILMLGISLLRMDRISVGGHHLTQYGALMGGTIGSVALVGYLYDVRSLYQVGEFASISLSAAILLTAIGVGILCARPEKGFMAILASEDLGGLMLRRVLPFALGLPILAGWIRITAQRSGHYGFNFGVALAVATVILVVLSALWVLAGTLNRTDGQKKHLLQILQQREARHRLALKAGRMGTFHHDLDRNSLILSPELETMFGLVPSGIDRTFDTFENFLHPDDRHRVVGTIREAVRQRSSYDMECRILHSPSAEEKWIAITGQVLPDATGHPRQITGVMFDITQRKRAEQALRDSEGRFRHLFEQASDGIVTADMLGRYLDINNRGCQMLGYSRAELLDMRVTDLLSPQDYPRLKDIQAEVLDGHRHSGEWTLRRKDGGFITVEVSAKLQPDQRWHAIVRDITERKRAEAGLRESESQFRMLADATPVMVCMAGIDKSYTWLNKSWLDYTGRKLEDELGEGWSSGIHPDDVTQCLQTSAKHFDRREPFEMEYRLRKSDGAYGSILHRAVPLLTAGGKFSGYLHAAIDITDRKQSEARLQQWTLELEQRVQERTEALLRTQERLRALATDLSATEQQERRRLATELHDYLAQLLVVGRMKLGQARPLAGDPKTQKLLDEADDVLTQSLNYTRFLVAELSPQVLYQFGLPAALKWLGGQMKTHGLSVAVHCDVDQISLAEESAVILYQSVRELLFNVVKHAGTGEATVALACDAQQNVKVTVSDRGRGFDQAVMEESDRQLPGRFGLFNVQERIEAMGGQFDLFTQPGSGTSITLTAPFDPPSAVPPFEPDAVKHAQASPIAPSQRLRILLVDDHAMVRQGLRSVLESYHDLEVVGEGGDGEAAINLADQLQPDVVVMDINMPKVDGIEATRRILSRHPDTVIIGLSVQNEHHIEEMMVQAGAAVFVTKERAAGQLYEAIIGSVRTRA